LHLPGDWQLHATLRIPAPIAITSLAFSPDGSQLAAACSDGVLRRWDCQGRNPSALSSCGESVETILRPEWMISGLAWAPDGQKIYTAQMDGTVRLWQPARSVSVPTLELSPLEGQSFVVTAPDGRRDASVGLPLGPSPSPDLWRLVSL
jgi:WD40 repeat protein